MKEEPINNRIKNIIDQYFNGNVRAFCIDISVAYSTIVGIVGMKQNSPTDKTIQKILNVKKLNINPEWLLVGKGDIVLKSAVESPDLGAIDAYKKEIKELKTENSQLMKKINSQYEEINTINRDLIQTINESKNQLKEIFELKEENRCLLIRLENMPPGEKNSQRRVG